MKAENYRKKKCKTKSEKFRKKKSNAEAFENIVGIYLLRLQKAWDIFLKGPGVVWRQKVQEREENAKQKVNKFKKKRNTEEKCEYLAENYLL